MDMKAAYLLHFQSKSVNQADDQAMATQQVEPEAWGNLCYRVFTE